MWHGLEGIGWGWIGLALLHLGLFIVLCIAVLLAIYRRSGDAADRVSEILKMRYAKGEIGRDELERLTRELAGRSE